MKIFSTIDSEVKNIFHYNRHSVTGKFGIVLAYKKPMSITKLIRGRESISASALQTDSMAAYWRHRFWQQKDPDAFQ